MKETNLEPNFSSIWNSLRKKKKGELRVAYCKDAGDIGHVTFYNKKKESDWTEMEKDWWAKALEISKEQLFPNK